MTNGRFEKEKKKKDRIEQIEVHLKEQIIMRTSTTKSTGTCYVYIYIYIYVCVYARVFCLIKHTLS
jgi:hypothetical protein